MVTWDIVPCSALDKYQRWLVFCSFHRQGTRLVMFIKKVGILILNTRRSISDWSSPCSYHFENATCYSIQTVRVDVQTAFTMQFIACYIMLLCSLVEFYKSFERSLLLLFSGWHKCLCLTTRPHATTSQNLVIYGSKFRIKIIRVDRQSAESPSPILSTWRFSRMSAVHVISQRFQLFLETP